MPAATMGVSDLKGANMSVEQASGHEPVELGFIESLENMISVQEGSTVSGYINPNHLFCSAINKAFTMFSKSTSQI